MRDWDRVPFPELDEDTLAAICDRHSLPQPTGRLPSNGAINSIWLLGHELVLRVPKNMDEGWKDTLTESVAAPVAVASGMKTPSLVVFDESLELVQVPFTVYERIRAEAGGPSGQAGWRHLGQQVALLHDRVVECADPQDRLDDARRWIDHDSILKYAADHTSIEREIRLRLEVELRRLEPSISVAQNLRRFLHNDLHPGNLLARGDQHVAVIDWGDAGWGDPAKEMSNLPLDAVGAFIAGYQEVMPFDDHDSIEDRMRWDRLIDALLDDADPTRAVAAMLDSA